MAQENDIILIYFENNPLVFARIEDISPDIKPDWYHVKLLILQIPVQVVTWILRNAYINGEEFTMNGKKMRLERVVPPKVQEETNVSGDIENPDKHPEMLQKTTGADVISLADLKKK